MASLLSASVEMFVSIDFCRCVGRWCCRIFVLVTFTLGGWGFGGGPNLSQNPESIIRCNLTSRTDSSSPPISLVIMGCILMLIYVIAESNGLRVVVRLLSPVFEKRVNSELLCSSFNHPPSFPFEVFIYLFFIASDSQCRSMRTGLGYLSPKGLCVKIRVPHGLASITSKHLFPWILPVCRTLFLFEF